ncbi:MULTISPECIES: hemolysin III family protein [Mesoflavibacter]|jgi:hemolysin III|uniref:Hemolysin III family protein n=1 Tax=Mesoflavibacter zeaxanthinifaciens subsp. sabulilitoris TaxID=1520893 RepID=A0A2T1NEY0_9FLAO|nr:MULTISPECIES: hemolysin III family protein [Mesoflavibacter]MBB3124915.1 hemolysin III [Mesoflavibacter zeaxanthinifaciens subsp. sabulilitoris]PSG91004.1 hemolysin III family protein [Mesoflavibacter zeaxanthinifaciens subsp. sabulilitoris]UAB74978.1 hemolysin III family protein [Mesoflavibacter sp. SCSIO 43206]
MRKQTPFEEKLNALTHAIGAVFGIVALVLLIIFETKKTEFSLFSVVVYGISIIILFTASTMYHSFTDEKKKHYFRIVDHISIYLLIAGTYTPVLLITLEQSKGWLLFYIVWAIAGFGVILKLFFTGKFEAFSTILYLVMGWLIVFDFSTLNSLMPANGIVLLMAGGLAYTVGIVFYAIEKIPYNHVIWHLFVLAGAICHFFMVLFFVV